MSLNKKHFDLLNSIEKFNTLSDLADFLNTSERNIRYQIEELNFELKEKYKIQINKQNLFWKGVSKNYEEVFIDINKIYYSFSTTERIALFIYYSLILKKDINLVVYSNLLEVSKPTLKNDMKILQEQLKKNNIYLIQNSNSNYLFEYSDLDFCFFLVSFLNKYIVFNENEFKPRKKSFFYFYFFKLLNPNVLFKINQLEFNNFKLNIPISDEAFNLFVLFLCILITYNPNIHYKNNITFFKMSSEFDIIDQNFKHIKTDYKLWLCDFLIGISYNLKNPLTIFKNWLNIEMETYKIILKFSNLKNIALTEDKVLYDELLNHLKPLLYRALKNLNLGNSILREVEHNYKTSLDICKIIFTEFEKKLDVKISDDEIAFVVLLFERAIQRNEKNKAIKNVAIVCNFGISTSSFLKMRIHELFKINCIKTYSLQEYQTAILDNFDLIITTIDLEKTTSNIPIVKVSPVLNKTDIELLKNFTFDISTINVDNFIYDIKNFCEKLDNDNLKNLLINKYPSFFYEAKLSKNVKFIEPFLFKEVDHISSIEEGIKICASPLLEHNYIDSSYITSLIDSSLKNNNDNIYIGEKTIFPHCINNNNVYQTKFSFLKLKKSIRFKNRTCSLIICFCTNEKNIYHDFLFKLFEIFENKTMEKNLYSLNIAEYYNYFKNLK